MITNLEYPIFDNQQANKPRSLMLENSSLAAIDFAELTGDIVTAYVSNNSVPPSDIPDLIHTIHAALSAFADKTVETVSGVAVKRRTAFQIRQSVTPNGIISFVDGKTYKSMKRHLTKHGFDPESYRQRFGLPINYPMVAPNYAAQRSTMAKSMGFGRVANRNDSGQPEVA